MRSGPGEGRSWAALSMQMSPVASEAWTHAQAEDCLRPPRRVCSCCFLSESDRTVRTRSAGGLEEEEEDTCPGAEDASLAIKRRVRWSRA